MRRLLSDHLAAELDRLSHDDYGLPAELLIEEAGLRVALAVAGDRPQSYLVLAGPGHNGRDALAAARYLSQGHDSGVKILYFAGRSQRPEPPELVRCRRLGLPVRESPSPEICGTEAAQVDVVVDGLFGTGLKTSLGPDWHLIFKQIRTSARRLVAIDLPSGLGDGWRPGDPVLQADQTLTIGFSKVCQYLPTTNQLSGRIKILPLAFPQTEKLKLVTGADRGNRQIFLLQPNDWQDWVHPLPAEAYKTTRGHTAIVGGSPGLVGAALLAGRGAQAARSGYVSLVFACRMAPALGALPATILTRTYDLRPTEALPSKAVLVVGPGWGRDPERSAELADLLRSSAQGVLDADGLVALSRLNSADLPAGWGRNWVLTPHWGELATLTGRPVGELKADPWPVILDYCQAHGTILVVKGSDCLIGTPDGSGFVASGQNPALGCAGSGDVLAGIIGGLWAGGLEPQAAALAGVLIHQQAGRRAFQRWGFFNAEELAAAVARLLGRWQAGR